MNLNASLFLQPATAVIHQHLVAIVLAFLGQHAGHDAGSTVVLLHDSDSIDLAAATQRAAAADAASLPTWLLAPWSLLVDGQASAFFASAPLVVVVVRQPPHLVADQLSDAFDWHHLNSLSHHLVLVEHEVADAANTQRFVGHSAHAGRLVTLAIWSPQQRARGAVRLFRPATDIQPPQLDYYLSLDPPHAFRTVDSARSLDFGGSEVWLVGMLADALNRSVHYHVYDYASFQPDDCADCKFYQQHYTQPLRVRSGSAVAPPVRSTSVTAANNRMLRKLSHSGGPVVYTGLSHLQLNDLDIWTQSLYPYSYENYRIVVPAELQRPSNSQQLLLLAAWLATLLVLFGVRLAVRRWLERIGAGSGAGGGARLRTAAALGMETLGVALATTTARQPRLRAEWLWLGTLSAFALTVGIGCSGVLFQRLTVPVEQNTIETLQQLVADGRYNLMVPFSESLPAGLSEGLRRKNLDIYTCNVPFILEMIWTRKPNFAYVIPESKLSIFNTPHLWYHNRCVFRVLDEIFYGRFVSLKISPWYLRPVAERTIHLANDHGQFVHFQRWSSVVSEFSADLRPAVRYQPGHDRHLAEDMDWVSFDDLSILFNAYLVANGLAVGAFAVELGMKYVRVRMQIVS